MVIEAGSAASDAAAEDRKFPSLGESSRVQAPGASPAPHACAGNPSRGARALMSAKRRLVLLSATPAVLAGALAISSWSETPGAAIPIEA
jgi:hypothetical protein